MRIEEASLFLTYMDESLLGVWRVCLQDKLDGVCNATLVHSYHRWLEDNLWDPAWKSMVLFPGCWRESGNKTRICIHRYIPHSQASIQFSDLVIENWLAAREPGYNINSGCETERHT